MSTSEVNTVEELQQLSRRQLQLLCKGHGLKANSKTPDLLDSLIKHLHPEQTKEPATAPAAPVASSSRTATGDKDEMGMATPHRAEPAAPSVSTIVYRTSPNTKATLIKLQSMVNKLQSELEATSAVVKQLEQDAGRLRAPTSSAADVEALIEARLEAFKLTMLEKVERHGLSATNQLTAVAVEERLYAVEALQADRAIDGRESLATTERPQCSTPYQAQASTETDAPPTTTFATFSSPVTAAVASAATPARLAVDENRGPKSAARGKTPRAASRQFNAIPCHVLASGSLPSPRRAGPSSPAPPTRASLGKRGRDSNASTQSVEVEAVLSPPQHADASTLSIGNVSAGHVRKRLRVSEAADRSIAPVAQTNEAHVNDSLDDSAAFETVEEGSMMATRDTIVPLNDTTTRSPSRDPSFFASVMAPGTPSRSAVAATSLFGHKSAPPTSRKSLPMATLPFPIVSPFKSARKSTAGNAARLFADASNAISLSPAGPIRRPSTPAADRTLYGTEAGSRFADVASPYAGPQW